MKKIRIVFIGGFLTPNGWKCHPNTHEENNIEVINVYPSPVGSIHDRVCEIFYELIGGRVYYGHDHSEFHGHDPYGKEFLTAKIFDWNEENPVYLVGHSYGGVTARAFQTYLAEKRFSGYDTNERWIAGIVTVNSPLNGALMTYLLGAHAHFPPIVSWGSVGYILSNIVHLSAIFGLDEALGFQFGHWNLSYNHPDSAAKFCDSILGVTVGSNTDNAAYDMTIQSQLKWAQVLPTYPSTHYLSIVGRIFPSISQVEPAEFQTLSQQFSRSMYSYAVHLFFYLISVKDMKVSNIDCSHWFYYGWDGLVSCYSQIKPALPSQFYHPCEQSISNLNISTMTPGVWYSRILPNDHLRVALCCPETWNLIWHSVIQMNSNQSTDDKKTILNGTNGQSVRPDLQDVSINLFNRENFSYPIHSLEKFICGGTTLIFLLVFVSSNIPELYGPLSFLSLLFSFGVGTSKNSYSPIYLTPAPLSFSSEQISVACHLIRSLLLIYLMCSLDKYSLLCSKFTIIASKGIEVFLLCIFCDRMSEHSSLLQPTLHVLILCLNSIPLNQEFLWSLLVQEWIHCISKLGWLLNSFDSPLYGQRRWWSFLWITYFAITFVCVHALTQALPFGHPYFLTLLWEWLLSMKEISYAYQFFKLSTRKSLKIDEILCK